jgi:hypothetical protein
MTKILAIISFISKFFREETKKISLGRWTISYCPNSIKKNIDSGNHDHCGPCGINNTKEISLKKIDNIDTGEPGPFGINNNLVEDNEDIIIKKEKKTLV